MRQGTNVIVKMQKKNKSQVTKLNTGIKKHKSNNKTQMTTLEINNTHRFCVIKVTLGSG